MTIENHNIDLIEEKDLQILIDAQVPEGLRLEFKLKCYGTSNSDKRELLKDVSAIANSQGGNLIIGIEEENGVAKSLVGVEVDTDAEILRMEQILRNAIDPPIPGIRIRSIKINNGKNIIFIRIPRSWYPPHRVTAQGTNKFYARHSAGVHEPSIEELRTLFNQSAHGIDKAREFRDLRISKILGGEGERPLIGEGRLILHIVPLASISGLINLDLEEILKVEQSFLPISASGGNPRFNFNGYINERGGDHNHGYTQVFRNGTIEATKATIVRMREGTRIIAARSLENDIFQRLPGYIDGLKALGVPAPLIIMLSLEGVKGAEYSISSNPWDDERPRVPEEILLLPECVIDDYGDVVEYHKAVRPAFDALWNTAGYSKSKHFNKEGLWVRQP